MEITAPQLDRELLDRLVRLFGGTVYYRPNKGRGIHVWQLSGPRAAGVMMTLFSMLSLKRKREISTAIGLWRARPGTGIRNREKTTCPRGHPYDTVLTLTATLKNGSRKTARRCSICYAAWWAKNGSRYSRAKRKLRLLEPQRLIPQAPEPSA